MSESEKVRFSRDGDQFHYLWAARRCLQLLSPTSGLVAISIEGPSLRERIDDTPIEAGEEIIDVGEYFGSEDVSKAKLVRYIQLKHSTQNPDLPWQPSGLENTLKGFSARYIELKKALGGADLSERLELVFATNRPISEDVLETVEDAANHNASRHPKEVAKLERFTGLKDDELASFCQLLRLDGGQEEYRLQRSALAIESKHYLPGDDVDAPIRLKELVTRKALSESASNPAITKADVLRALGTTEDRVFPARSRIAPSDDAVPRAQEHQLVKEIVSATGPVVIQAASGVGKSVFSQRIGLNLPPHSIVTVYDCFGNGEYRRAASLRHRHKDALVQIANELAAQGLCDPLIPSSNADNSDYLRAFVHRLKQSAGNIRAASAEAILCLAIDAADNAEKAAKEFGDARSFVRDLLRIESIDGVRLVALCRPERLELLDVPANIIQLELKPFNRDETASFLRKSYPEATDNDIDEFHRLTSSNPRLQATALSQPAPLAAVLRSLGPNPTSVDDAIANILRSAIAQLRERAGSLEHAQIDILCEALATLRPLVPIPVLSKVSGVPGSAVESFAIDLGRPLLVSDGAIQFRDEPVETWFRNEFRPSSQRLGEFVNSLRPLAAESAYVASTLPQLMLEAGQLKELVELALSSSHLPENSPVQKRDVEINRLQFALKASLRDKDYVSASKLAMKAGEEAAGDTRQQKLLQENTDVAAALLERNTIQEIVSRRVFGGGWIGAHHVYEAGLLSHIEEFRGDARSRARMAYECLQNWSRLPEEDRKKERVEDDDIAELAMVRLNLDGPEACATELGRWSPREVSFRCGRIIAKRLVDHEKYDVLNQLSQAAGRNLCLFLAVNCELRTVHRYPPEQAVRRALRLILRPTLKIKGLDLDSKESAIAAIVALVESAAHFALVHGDKLASLLDRYLPDAPPYSLTSRHGGGKEPLLRAYTLRAALRGSDLQLLELARPEIRKEMEEAKSHSSSRELQEFKEDIGSLLPWHKLRAAVILSKSLPDIKAAIAIVRGESSRAERNSYGDERYTPDEVALIWFEILDNLPGAIEDDYREFLNWAQDLKRPLFTPTWTRLARLSARRPALHCYAHNFARRAYELTKEEREDAEAKAHTYVEISRALFCLDRPESGEYFNRAVEVASKFGDEIIDRWQAMTDLADHAADPGFRKPKAAYEFARCAELTYKYIVRDKHFDWDGTVKAIANLCPSSCFAILSRWRDRDFGWPERLLATSVHHLLEVKRLDARVAIALMGYRANWEYPGLLAAALPSFGLQTARANALHWALRYITLVGQSPSDWRTIEDVAVKNRLSIPDIEELVAYAAKQEASSKMVRGESNSPPTVNEKGGKEKDWGTIFAGLTLHTSQGIVAALKRFEETAAPYYKGPFATQLFARVSPGNSADCIRSISEVADFGLYDYREVLEAIPTEWHSRMAVQSALKELARQIASRYCLAITRSRFYQPMPLKMVNELTGISENDFISVVIESLAHKQESFDSGRLFSLVGLLSSQLSHSEAEEALDFGLGMYAGALEDEDGDGAWTGQLMPPEDIGAAVAGYIWVGLASPKATLRWESAHVVRGLGAIGAAGEIGHLIVLANKGDGGNFTHSRLHFYKWHALLWLTISLARIAKENPAVVSPHSAFLVDCALAREPHVLVRRFAAEATLSLVENSLLKLDPGVLSNLRAVNISRLPVQASKRYSERKSHNPPMHRDSGGKRFTFGYDMSRYWFDSLGDCFGMSSSDVEMAAEKVICDSWRLSENGHWDRDARARLGLFRDMASSHSHGSYPRVDDLNFYLSYHSMLTVAGEWLATIPLHQDPDDAENEFNEWLGLHLLCRSDGRWLADRRDPTPTEWPGWKDEKQGDDWRWSVGKLDFDRVLGVADERLNLWGHWTYGSGMFEESVHINSALVFPNRTTSLVRALQTATDSHDYRVPDAGDDLEIDNDEFQLRGWVVGENSRDGLDKFDPWAGDIRIPPLMPAKYIAEALQLASDVEGRCWKPASTDVEGTIWVQIWGGYSEKDDDSVTEHGHRLQASPALLIEMLRRVERDLIVKVEIERKKRHHRYEGYKNDNLGFIPNYVKIFSFGADGKIRAFR